MGNFQPNISLTPFNKNLRAAFLKMFYLPQKKNQIHNREIETLSPLKIFTPIIYGIVKITTLGNCEVPIEFFSKISPWEVVGFN